MRRFDRKEAGKADLVVPAELGFIPLSGCSAIPKSGRKQSRKAGLGWLWDSWVWLRIKGFWLPPRLLLLSQTSTKERILWL